MTPDSPTFDPAESQEQPEQQDRKPPTWKKQVRHLSVAVFPRQTDANGTWHNAVFQRSFKDRSGEWQQQSVSLSLAEISTSIRLLKLARQHMESVSVDR